MTKEAYYFSHDANARQDEKILMLRAEHGWEGYGIFWALVEMMFESSDTKLHHNKIKGIAVSYNIDITLLQGVINTCITEELFVSDDVVFWSETLKRRKEKYREIKTKKSEAGKKGMAKRWSNQQSDNTVITDDNSVITKNNKGKESKVKEMKLKESKGNINKESDNNAFEFYQQNFGMINSFLSDEIGHWIDDLNDELVIEAMKRGLEQNKRNWGYVKGILKSWQTANVKSLDDVKAIDTEFKNKGGDKIEKYSGGYEQYDFDKKITPNF